MKAPLTATDPEGEPLKVEWRLVGEAARYATGRRRRGGPAGLPRERGPIVERLGRADHAERRRRVSAVSPTSATARAGAAVANVPLLVKGPVELPEAKVATLPLVIYDEAADADPPYAPSGCMGNTKAIKMDPACADRPHAGKTCLRVEYAAKADWGGVVWQSPANDWGDKPGGFDITGAKTLSFWARGEEAARSSPSSSACSAATRRSSTRPPAKLDKVTLKPEWKQYTIDLKGRDLARIKTGFAWVLAADGKPVTFYLDDVRYE